MPSGDDLALGQTAASDGDAPSAELATLDAPAVTIAAASDRLPEVSAERYAIAGEVGRGGLGRVMRARDRILDREVALKELLGNDEAARRRFVREALITARLQHPSIVPVYEAARWKDRAPFYAMKLVGGRPLSDAIEAAATLDARLGLVPTVLAVADAIAYAHGQRIVHRDLKPGNVLVGEFGETVVIDWGLAKDLAIDDRDALDAGPYREAAGDQTVAGAVLGTPAYMAPEQAAGDDVDERTDVYAIGAILYHVLGGAIPHRGKTLDEVIRRILAGDVAPLVRLESRVPADLAAIVAKAMARDPAARYPSARELAVDLRRFQTGQLVGAHRYTLAERIARWVRRHRAVAAVATAATLVLVVFGTWSIRRILAERDEAAKQRDAAIAQSNRVVLAQARAAEEHDPAAVLAWLAQLDPRGPGWEIARVLAATATTAPPADVIVRGLPPAEGVIVGRDGRHVLLHGASGLWVGDVVAGRGWRVDVRIEVYARPALCDDGRRVLGWGLIDADVGAYEIDLETGAVTRPSMAHDESDAAQAACATGARLIRRRDEWLRWDAAAGRFVHLAAGDVIDAWMTADGSHVLGISAGGGLIRWDADGHRVERPGLRLAARPPASDDGGVIAIAGDPTIVVDVVSGEQRAIAGAATGVGIAPDGRWIAIAHARDVMLFDASSGELRHQLAASAGITTISISSRWVLGADGERVVVWDVELGKWVRDLRGHVGGVELASFAADGRPLTVGLDGTLRLWSPASRLDVELLPGVVGAWLSSGGRWLLTDGDDGVRRLDRGGAEADEATAIPGASNVARAVVTDDGEALFSTRVGILRWRRGRALESLGTHDGGPDEGGAFAKIDLAFTIDGIPLSWDGVTLVSWEPGAPRRIAVGARAPSEIWFATPAVSSISVSPAGRWVAVTSNRDVHVVDLIDASVRRLDGAAIVHAGFSSDGSRLATASVDGGLLIWDVATARPRRLLGDDDEEPVTAIFSPDGARVVLAGSRRVHVVEVATGAERSFAPTARADGDVRFSPRGDRLLVTSNGSVHVWSVAAGEGQDVEIHGVRSARLLDDRVVIARAGSIVTIPDDLPVEASPLSAHLRALRYRLVDDPDHPGRYLVGTVAP